MNEVIALFIKVNGNWMFTGFAHSEQECKEEGQRALQDREYDAFRSFKLED